MTTTLIDVTDTARQAGIRWPTSITQAVNDDCVAWTSADTKRTGWPQDEAGRLWDVLWLASRALRVMNGGSALYALHRVPRDLTPADLDVEEDYEPPLVTLRIAVVVADDRSRRLVISHTDLD